MRILFVGTLLAIVAAVGCQSTSGEKVHAGSGKLNLATAESFWGAKELGDIGDN